MPPIVAATLSRSALRGSLEGIDILAVEFADSAGSSASITCIRVRSHIVEHKAYKTAIYNDAKKSKGIPS